MANQIVVSSGAKVRNLNDVIIGTSGVLSSLAFNVANGVPKLDVNGKILVSQLPNSVMEYLGTWNAATNTPFLVNGTGNAGDVYLCNVAGTVDFGAGPITFVVSDQVIYSGSIWQKASGSNGTVTSVAVTESGDSLNITGSPITTSGTINIGFNGTNLQYINGAGDLTTFPTLLSSVGLSMPSAFNVSNSPLTANGTIGVTGAGVASQYIRGDGTLADFPTSGGGGSSVSYYLNGGTSQGVIGGITYYEMSKIADTGTGVDFPKTGDGLIVSFLTDANDPAQLNIPAGNWNYEIYVSMSANGGTPQLYAELYKYDGTTFTLIATSPNEILYDGTNLNMYSFGMAVPATSLTLTDRLAVKLYSTNSGGKITTVHTQNGHLCQIITTFSTGITALNGLTAQVQYFATGTSGTDFAINSSTATHTFNLPVASAANTGKLSSTDWSTFNGKVPYTGATADVNLGIYSITAAIGTFTNGVLNGNGTNPANLYLKKGSSPFFTNAANYGLIAAVSSSFILISDVDGTNYKYASFNLGSLTNNTNRAFTLPNASGTLALLESTQTFTGSNTFTNTAIFESSGGTGLKYGASIYKGFTPFAFSSLGVSMYADATTNNIIFRDDLSKAKLIFNNSDQTYTFPASSGTIALTSDLSSYVTLATTQTISGLKKFDASLLLKDSATISTTAGYLALNFVKASTQSSLYLTSDTGFTSTLAFNNAASYNYTFPAATGTLALGTGTTNYHAKFTGASTLGNSLIWDNGTNVGIGNTNTSYTLDVSGTGRFTGALRTESTINMAGTNAQLLQTVANSIAGDNVAVLYNSNANSYGLYIGAGSGTNHALYITDSTRTANLFKVQGNGNVGIGTNNPGGKLEVVGGANTYQRITNSTNSISLDFLVGPTEAFIGTPANYALRLGTNDTERMRITSGGFTKISNSGTYLNVSATYHELRNSTNDDWSVVLSNSSSPSPYGLLIKYSGASPNNASNNFLTCSDSTQDKLNIYSNGNVVNRNNSYGPFSDIKLKENITDSTPKLDKLMQVRIVNYNLIGDELNQIGVIAQELEQVFPGLVDEHIDKDDENNDLGTTTKSVKMSVFVPILIKSIQEQNQIIQELNERLNKAGL